MREDVRPDRGINPLMQVEGQCECPRVVIRCRKWGLGGGGGGVNDTTRKKILMSVALHIPCLVGYRERYNSS